jgi:hypothetical protein
MGLIDGAVSLFRGRPTQTNIAKVLNESIAETVLKSKSSCINSISSGQTLSIDCTSVTAEIAAIYADSAACLACVDSDREYCEMCYPCAQVGNIQTAVLSITSNCEFDSTDVTKAANEFVTGIKQQASTKNELDPLSRFIDGVFGDVSANQNNSTETTNRIKNTMSQERINEGVSQVINSQNIELVGMGGQFGNLQSNSSSIVATNMWKDASYREAVNTAATQIDQLASQEQSNALFLIIIAVIALIVIYFYISSQNKKKKKQEQQDQRSSFSSSSFSPRQMPQQVS